MQLGIVLVGDQHLGNVPLGGGPDDYPITGEGSIEVGERGHRSVTVPSRPTVTEIDYTIRRSGRARRVRVTVDAARGIEVVLPQRAPEREAAAAIRELRPWIERRVAELDRARAAVAARGATVPYLGNVLRVVAQPGRTRAHRRGGELLVPDGGA